MIQRTLHTWRLCVRHLRTSSSYRHRASPLPPPPGGQQQSPTMTPIMNQYFSFKRDPQYGRNCVVLFQLGGFYEAFFSDAEVVSNVCGVVLTTKGQSLYRGAPIEMAGLPVDRCDSHVGKLLRRGYRVVMVDQTEGLLAAAAGRVVAPKGGPAASAALAAAAPAPPLSSVLGRAVTRVFTPGTASPEYLGGSPMGHHYTAALAFGAHHPLGSLALAACDVATGEVQVRLLDVADLGAALASVAPIELVLPTENLCEVGPPPFLKASTSGRSGVRVGSGGGGGGGGGGSTGMTLEAALVMFAREESKGSTTAAAATAVDSPSSLRSHRRHGLQALEEALVPPPPRGSPGVGGGGGGERGGGVLKLPLPGGDSTFLTLFPATGFTAREGLRACAQMAVHSGGGEEDYADFSDLELAALGGLMSYIKWTHVGVPLPRLSQPIKVLTSGLVEDAGGAELPPLAPPSSPSIKGGLPEAEGEASAADAAGAALALSVLPPHSPSPPPTSPHTLFRPPSRMRINESTAAALELVRPNHRPRRSPGCLLARIDRCRTHMGSRLLDGRVCAPLASLTPILHRLDAVAGFLARDGGGAEAVLVRGAVRARTGRIGDLERAFQRVAATHRPSPRDLCTLRDGLLEARKLGYLLASWAPTFSVPPVPMPSPNPPMPMAHPQPPSPLPHSPLTTPSQQQKATTTGTTSSTGAALPSSSPLSPLITTSQSRALEAFPPTLPTRPAELPLYLLLASQSHFDVLWEGSSPVSTHPSGSHCLSLATSVLAWPWDAPGAAQGWEGTASARDFSAWDSPPAAVANAHGSFALLGNAVRELCAALVSDGSSDSSGGSGGGEGGEEGSSNFIKKGYDPELDAARALARDTGEVQSELEEEFRGVFGLGRGANSVRVRRLEKEGYVLEVDVKVKGVRERLESVLRLQRVEEEAMTTAAAASRGGSNPPTPKKGGAVGVKVGVGSSTTTSASATSHPPPSPLESLLQLEGGSLRGGAGVHTVHSGTPTSPPPPLTLRPVRSTETLKRFRCDALVRLDALSFEASARVAALESRLLYALGKRVIECEPALKAVARGVALVDVSASLALLAEEAGLSRPTVTATGRVVQRRGARASARGGDEEEAGGVGVVGEGGGCTTTLVGSGELCLRGVRHLGVEDALWRSNVGERVGGGRGEGEGGEGGVLGGGGEREEGGEAVEGEGGGGHDFATTTTPSLHPPSKSSPHTSTSLAPRHSSFVANDIVLGAPAPWLQEHSPSITPPLSPSLAQARCVLLTGPNMGGKSTYLRAASHAVILSHIGCYIAAAPGGLIGLTDAVYSRVGASDDLSRHRSTFMSEMMETGDILRGATRNSLVLVDEIGRGTGVVDGLAISLAVLEDLVGRCGSKTLFATHFAELAVTGVGLGEGGRGGVRCMQMGWFSEDSSGGGGGGGRGEGEGGGGGFLPSNTHKIELHPIHTFTANATSASQGKGGGATSVNDILALASCSHGLIVARHAELPNPVISRAQAIVTSLQASGMPQAWAAAVGEAHSLPQGKR